MLTGSQGGEALDTCAAAPGSPRGHAWARQTGFSGENPAPRGGAWGMNEEQRPTGLLTADQPSRCLTGKSVSRGGTLHPQGARCWPHPAGMWSDPPEQKRHTMAGGVSLDFLGQRCPAGWFSASREAWSAPLLPSASAQARNPWQPLFCGQELERLSPHLCAESQRGSGHAGPAQEAGHRAGRGAEAEWQVALRPHPPLMQA